MTRVYDMENLVRWALGKEPRAARPTGMRYFKTALPDLPVRVFRVDLESERVVADRWERDHWKQFAGILGYVFDHNGEAVNTIKEISKAEAEMLMSLGEWRQND